MTNTIKLNISWCSALPTLLVLARDAVPEVKNQANFELLRMAAAADTHEREKITPPLPTADLHADVTDIYMETVEERDDVGATAVGYFAIDEVAATDSNMEDCTLYQRRLLGVKVKADPGILSRTGYVFFDLDQSLIAFGRDRVMRMEGEPMDDWNA